MVSAENMIDMGCVVKNNVSNNIMCSLNTAVRTSPSRMGTRMRSTGRSSAPPWRGVSVSSLSIGRTRPTTRGSRGSTSSTQSNAVERLVAVHLGLIGEQTNNRGGVETDQWDATRHSREPGANGSQAAGSREPMGGGQGKF